MLRLRPLRIEDERAALAAHAALKAEGHEMLLDYRRDDTFVRYLARREANRLGHMLPPRWVSSTLLVAEVSGALVGRTSIRHELNDWLAKYGGHIGYVVLPEQRRKGYATEILRQALVVAHSIGIDDVLVTCDDTNVASARVIEKCGGRVWTRWPAATGCYGAGTGFTDGRYAPSSSASRPATRAAISSRIVSATPVRFSGGDPRR